MLLMYMVYLSYMYVYSVISTACERGLGCLVGWLPGRAAGGYFENVCAIQGYLQIPLYRRESDATARDCDGKCECVLSTSIV